MDSPVPMNPQVEDLTGKVFGRLTVVHFAGHAPDRRILWLCKCECGNEKIVRGKLLKRGDCRSCGCLHRERFRKMITKHGKVKTPEYQVWGAIIRRCYSSNTEFYYAYGGRGIKMCDRWRESFEAFYADMGPRPGPEYSIDRIDVNGDYTPQNCRWATRKEQARNTRKNHIIEFQGERRTLAEWGEITGLGLALGDRIRGGWSVEEALTIPIWRRRKKPPQPCSNCGLPAKPIAKGRCMNCWRYFHLNGVERPAQLCSKPTKTIRKARVVKSRRS